MLTDTSPPLSRYTEGIPILLQHTVKKMLAKEPDQRYQLIHDVRTDLGELIRDIADSSTGQAGIDSFATTARETGTPVAARSWPRRVPWAIVAFLLIIVGVFLWTQGRDESQPQPPARLDLVLPAEAPLSPRNRTPPALSPDGRRLVYVAQVDGRLHLYLRNMLTGETRAIPGTSDSHSPFFSPNGEWVGFFGEGKLKKVSLAGGEPVVLAEAPNPFGGAWGPDGTIYFNAHESEGLSRVSAGGGQVQTVTQGQDVWPDILPGETLLFSRSFSSDGVYALRNGEIRRVLSSGFHARYVQTGHLVYAEAGKLLAVPFDVATLEVTGPPVTLFEDLRTGANSFGVAHFALSQGGLLVYAPGQDAQVASLRWVDHQGKIEPLGFPPGIFGPFALSPDGKRLAVPIYEGAGTDIWLYDLARGTQTRFTYDLREDPRARKSTPRWTPDGEYIVYTSLDLSSVDDEVRKSDLFWKPADGNREAVQLLTTDELRLITGDASRLAGPDSFSPDRSVLTFFSLSPETGFDLWVLRLDDY